MLELFFACDPYDNLASVVGPTFYYSVLCLLKSRSLIADIGFLVISGIIEESDESGALATNIIFRFLIVLLDLSLGFLLYVGLKVYIAS